MCSQLNGQLLNRASFYHNWAVSECNKDSSVIYFSCATEFDEYLVLSWALHEKLLRVQRIFVTMFDDQLQILVFVVSSAVVLLSIVHFDQRALID